MFYLEIFCFLKPKKFHNYHAVLNKLMQKYYQRHCRNILMKEYKKDGFTIVILTARNMRTYDGNIGKLNIHTLPGIIEWLDAHQVPYDEVVVGKPWCGYDGFYVDDKAVRPSEFVSKTFEEITALIESENTCS